MKTRDPNFTHGAITLAIWGALCVAAVPLAARADGTTDEYLNALIQPTNYVDIGVLGVTKAEPHYGEYNGLNDSGPYAIGNVHIKGGDAYGEGTGTLHWELNGTDLGTTSRAADASVGNQGVWNLGIHFDQLRHYTTTGYQTPYTGSMGDNTFTLLPSFGVIARPRGAPGASVLTANQLSTFHTEDVYTERTNAGVKGGYDFNPQWGVTFSFNHLDQSGAKLISAATDALNPGPGGFSYSAESIAVLMNPTEYQTDTVSVGVHWSGERAHLSLSYDGSFFHDDYRGVTFSNPFVGNNIATGTNPGAAFPLDTMSTPPSNEYHQLNLGGGYTFSPATRFTGRFSIGRNTQNDSYAGTYTPGTVPLLPVSSLDGVVVTMHGDARLTHQVNKDLTLTLSGRYDKRDNQTASYTYTFLDLGGTPQTVVNIPMSNERYRVDLGGDYRIDRRQRLHAGYEFYDIQRWCDNTLANNAQGVGPSDPSGPRGAVYPLAAYYTDASCVQVPENQEHKFDLGYRFKPVDNLHLNAGYTYTDRNSTVNSAFYNPLQANSEGYENYGYLAFFDASRTQHLFKAGADWQPTSRLDIGVSGRYGKEDYGSTLGVQSGETGGADLDVSYSFSENYSVGAYATYQTRSRDLLTANGRDALNLLPNLWTNSLHDESGTLGLSARQKGLLGSRLQLAEDLNYSVDSSEYSTQLLYANNTVGVDGDAPSILSKTLQLKLTGTYDVDKHSKVTMGYAFEWVKSNDYYYNGYQYGYTPSNLIPTNQQAPDYTDHAIFAVYRYSFR